MEHKINGDSPMASQHIRKQVPSPLCNMSCCFGPKHRSHHPHHQLLAHHDGSSSPVHGSNIGLVRCSSVWKKSHRLPDHLPEIKDKCRSLISRIAHHRRRHSADFRYDALSYSQNFDQGAEDDSNVEEFPFRTFSSRLPPSPLADVDDDDDDDDDDDEKDRFTPSSRTKEIVSACS